MPTSIGDILKNPRKQKDGSFDPNVEGLELKLMGNMLKGIYDTGKSVAGGVYNVGKGIGKYAYDTFEADHNDVPYKVRLAVAGSKRAEDKLDTFKQFYPDATLSKDGEITFTDHKSGKKMTLDDPGLSVGDTISRIPDIGEVYGGILGTVMGGLSGAPAGPIGSYAGAVTGAGLGSATGNELFRQGAQSLSKLLTGKKAIDKRSLLDIASDFADTGSINAAFTSLPVIGMGGLLGDLGKKKLVSAIPNKRFWDYEKSKRVNIDSVDDALSRINPKRVFDHHLDDNVAKGARLSPDHSKVTIPEVKSTIEPEAFCGRYGDCVPSLVKNIYEEYGLPTNILYSKFKDHGFDVHKVDLNNLYGRGNIAAVKGSLLNNFLNGFGVAQKSISDYMYPFFKSGYNVDVGSGVGRSFEKERFQAISRIDKALESGNKVVVSQLFGKGGKSRGGHVYLITGKNEFGNYVTLGRGAGGFNYEKGNIFSPSPTDKLMTNAKDGTIFINEDAMLGDLGLTKASEGSVLPVYKLNEVKGVKRNLPEMQKDFRYPSPDNQPINLRSNELLKENADPRTRFWKEERRLHGHLSLSKEKNKYLRNDGFDSLIKNFDPETRGKYEQVLKFYEAKNDPFKGLTLDEYVSKKYGNKLYDPLKDLYEKISKK